MKHQIPKILLTLTGLFYIGALYALPTSMELNKDWQFSQARLTNWYPAIVPGTVHTDLMANKIIEDPFFRMNERDMQWIDKEDWIYETHFDLSTETFEKNNIRLCFKGLDTYADVYLNGEKILAANNMFRQWKVDVKSLLKKTDNSLKIYFHSPVKVDLPKWESLPFQYQASNDQSENGGLLDRKISVFARKAGYHYGWDWGPRLVTSGIWRPIILEAWNEARIENVQVIQVKVTKQSASLKTFVEVLSDKDTPEVILQIEDGNSRKIFSTVRKTLVKGLNRLELDFVIKNPKLWWSNGLGEAHLYDFKTTLSKENETLDVQNNKIGIRSLKLITTPDKDGETFHFELNGVPVFCKGANYIPCDNFLPRVTDSIYEKTVLDAVHANMNMLRVWGGGIYENDYFYDQCDKYGILIWQDFMFACSVYPFEGEFKENVRQEAIDNVKRLRNHPSIALWCGNNECNTAWFSWGWKEGYEKQNPEYAATIWKQYQDQFHVVLPEVVAQFAPGTSYRPSSPFYAFGENSDSKKGDNHFWGVWHAKAPITDYNTTKSRFFSEYGFQSFPEFESVKKYNPYEKDWDITSDVMMSHQRGGTHANGLIKSYLLTGYKTPKNFESFLYMTLILQGDAIKTAIEAHRRDMPYCMGTLFWQHNDCWPVASWSSRDYYGRWKAQHYFAREAYKDILVSPIEEKDLLNVYVVSDRLKDTKAKLTLTLMDLKGTIINTYSLPIKVLQNASKNYFSVKMTDLLKGQNRNEVVAHVVLETSNGSTYKNNYFFASQKEMDFPKTVISRTIQKIDGGYEVYLQSAVYARGVFLSLEGIDNFFDANYFDLLPNEKRTIKVKTPLASGDFEKQLKISSISDAS